jgi:hypothetical protein
MQASQDQETRLRFTIESMATAMTKTPPSTMPCHSDENLEIINTFYARHAQAMAWTFNEISVTYRFRYAPSLRLADGPF